MKKYLALLTALLLCISLIGCTADPATSSPDVGTANIDTPTSAEPTASPDDSQTAEEPTSEYYFADNTLVAEDVKIVINDYKVIPVGEEGNEYGEKPVIAFWYSVTNLSGNENVTPLTAWIAMFTAVQDNDPNMVNELDVGMLPDDAFLDTQTVQVKKDGTVDCAIAYELDDEVTPVTLTATRGVLGEELGSQTFEIA